MFGAPFLAAARAPLTLSCERFRTNLVGDGVRLLSVEHLHKGLTEGLSVVSALSRAKRSVVDRVGRVASLDAVALDVAADQPVALAAVRRDDLTITVFAMPQTASSPTAHLAAMADHFARDKHIAASLDKLAADVAAWEKLLGEAAERFDADPELVASHRRSKLVRVGAVAGTIVILASGAAFAGISAYRAREEEAARAAAVAAEKRAQNDAQQRILAAVGAADPCTPPDIEEADRNRATDEQKGKLAVRAKTCKTRREREAIEATCGALAERVARKEAGGTEALDAAAGALLGRITSTSLKLPDLLTEDAPAPGQAACPHCLMPCVGTPASAILWRAFSHAAANDLMLWTKVEAVSPRVAKALVADKESLSKAARRALTFQIERVATSALQQPTPENVAHAKVLCALKTEFDVPVAMSCRKVEAAH